jgi:hypothetical protein
MRLPVIAPGIERQLRGLDPGLNPKRMSRLRADIVCFLRLPSLFEVDRPGAYRLVPKRVLLFAILLAMIVPCDP